MVFLLMVLPASAMKVRDVVWGFDGQVAPERFNLVSVLVENDTAKPFDGALRLSRHLGVGGPGGAVYVQPVYVAPFTMRWVQFVPRISQDTNWRLSWPGGSDTLDAPRFGPPATAMLRDPDDPSPASGAFKAFPDVLFPTSVAAMDALDALVTDYAPRWELAKRAAMLDWLRQGGTLHLLKSAGGNYPVFGDDLAVLNTPAERTRVGAGLVVRHDATRRDVTEATLRASGFSLPKLVSGENTVIYQINDLFLNALAPLSKPRHAWGLIYLLAFAYIIAIGPGAYFIGKRRRSLWWPILIFFAMVAGFGSTMATVGRRGQGESSTVHTLSWARALGGGRYDVMQWSRVFATKGDFYTLHHDAPHNFYATGQEYEEVKADILGGKDGKFVVDIPVFSQRTMLHQGVMTGPDFAPRIVSNLTFAVSGEWPASAACWAVQGGRVYPLSYANGRLEAGVTPARPFPLDRNGTLLSEVFATDKLQQAQWAQNQFRPEDKLDVEERYRQLVLPLFGYSLGNVAGYPHYVTKSEMSGVERVRLFLFAKSPDSFGVKHPVLRHETGYVLYEFDLFPPEPGGEQEKTRL